MVDLGALNNGSVFSDIYKDIYPPKLQLKVERSGTHATILNLDITVKDGMLIYKRFESLPLIGTPANQYFILLLLVNFLEYLAVLFYTETLMKKLWNCLIEWKHNGHNPSKWVKGINLPSKLSFINGSIRLWGQEIPGNFQNKSVSSSFKCVSMYILFLTKLKVGGRSFLDGAVGGVQCEIIL